MFFIFDLAFKLSSFSAFSCHDFSSNGYSSFVHFSNRCKPALQLMRALMGGTLLYSATKFSQLVFFEGLVEIVSQMPHA